MGARGPVPKRAGTRVGHVSNAEAAGMFVTKAPSGAKKKPPFPAAPVEWEEISKRWYESLRKSGQSEFYEASDVAYAFFIAHEMNRYIRNGGTAMMFASLTGAMTSLLGTEGDRRRAGLELERGQSQQASPATAAIAAYREALLVRPKASEVGLADIPLPQSEAAATAA